MSLDLAAARQLARLMCPEREGPGATEARSERDLPSSWDAGTLVAGLRENKAPLLSLRISSPDWAWLAESEPFRQAVSGEESRWTQMRREYAPVRQAFEDAGIVDVLIKSVGIPPSLPYTSDNLDVLVPLEEGRRARELLWDLRYVELANVEEPHKFLFRRFANGATASAIHLHEFVGWGTGFMDDADVLGRSRLSTDDALVRIPCPEDGLLITMAHAFYEDKAIKLGDLWKVAHLVRGRDLDWDLAFRQAERRGWREGLATCIHLWSELERRLYGEHSFPPEVVQRAEEMPAYCRTYLQRRLEAPTTWPYGIAFGFSKRHYYRKLYLDRTLRARQKIVDAARHSWAGVERRLPIKLQRRMLVTLSGIDGSGKTAQAEGLRQAFAECGVSVTMVWSRGGSSALTDAVLRLVRPLLPRSEAADRVSDTRAARVARQGAWLRRPILRLGWAALVIADLVLQYWARVAWPLLKGHVVIADRYIYDALVELAALTHRASATEGLSACLLRWLAPRPRLAYLLRIPPQVAQQRKPDEALDHLADQAHAYEEVALAWGMRVVNATEALAESRDRLIHEVLTTYYRGWLGRGGA
ncbi:MAG: hypothetical protein FJZ90_09700 [Chloroflexi bacterium]|nr:hypothetical protein [Chloroflexota bacterium]